MSKTKTEKKLVVEIVAIIVLAFCLCVTTFALVYSMVSVEDNYFHTGTVAINLNDGAPVISEHEFLFEPGMTVKKNFFIENESTWAVYYKIYFDNVSGGLKDVLEITVKDGEDVICSGTAATLSRRAVGAAENKLNVNEKRELTVYFHFPEEAGNSAQNLTLSFDICAEAVQTKNNPNRLFD